MNYMEEFLNFGAVIKLRRDYDDELFKFIELMKSVGFLKEYAEDFEKSCCTDKEFKEFSEDVFWHYVKINGGNTYDTCLEFQWGKGFTWGDRKEYLNYDSQMKILNVDELIKSCNKENEFNLNYQYTFFKDELNDKEISVELDDFINFYDWSIVKYPDKKYNIKDEQTNSFDFEESTKDFNEIIDRVYYRMMDYFIDETEFDEEFKQTKEQFNKYIDIGIKLGLLDENNTKQYNSAFKDIQEEIVSQIVSKYFAEKDMKNLMEYGNDFDEGLYHLSKLYEDLMTKLDIEFNNIYTEDISDGKYVTTIIFRDDTEIQIDTNAFNGIEVVTSNLISVLEKYDKTKENILENEIESDYDYD